MQVQRIYVDIYASAEDRKRGKGRASQCSKWRFQLGDHPPGACLQAHTRTLAEREMAKSTDCTYKSQRTHCGKIGASI